MKKISFLFAVALAVTGLKSFAEQAIRVPLTTNQIILGYGKGFFPSETIKSTNGQFQLVAPQGLSFKSIEFTENFDSMCEFYAMNSLAPDSVILKVGPSSSEAAQCVLSYQLSNGETGQIIGMFASGD
jgi:hypothetical protein